MRPSSILIHGPRGAGKSTLGPLIANDLKWSFYDLDRLVEQDEDHLIQDIVAKVGWVGFRQLERRNFDDLIARVSHPFVLAVGGGFVAEGERFEALQEHFQERIWLDLPPQNQGGRIGKQMNQRPRLTTAVSWEKEFERLDLRRRPLDAALATITLDATRSVQELHQVLMRRFQRAD